MDQHPNLLQILNLQLFILHSSQLNFTLSIQVEELECLAVWKEGSSRYLVGKLHHNHATSNEDRFRCFVYEKSSATSEIDDRVDYRVAQSGDATCNGLFSATEGSRTMTLRKGYKIFLTILYWVCSNCSQKLSTNSPTCAKLVKINSF